MKLFSFEKAFLLISSFSLWTSCQTMVKHISEQTEPASRQVSSQDLSTNLKAHIDTIADEIGVRNLSNHQCYEHLKQAAAYIRKELENMGFVGSGYQEGSGLEMQVISYDAQFNGKLYPLDIIEATIHGNSDDKQPIVVMGAHYDSFRGGYEEKDGKFEFKHAIQGSPGADDNTSSVAAILEIAKHMKQFQREMPRTLRLVFFPNEEEPYSANFSDNMGSMQYAKRAKAKGEDLEVVILESIGYYTNIPNSQDFPSLPWLFKWLGYPTEGNFVAFTSDWNSGTLLKKCRAAFNEGAHTFPTARLSLPNIKIGNINLGRIIGRSDHKAFWDVHNGKNRIYLWDIVKRMAGKCDTTKWGFPAIMLTDTADLRNPHYHRVTDTSGTINYPAYTRVVQNLYTMTEHLVGVKKMKRNEKK